jgi:cytidylate kinase
MTLVAISAAYGAGGSRIGPAVAERLEVPFLDRAIPAAVSEALGVPFDEAAAHDEAAASSWLERLLRGFAGLDTGAPVPPAPPATSGEDFRRTTEQVLSRQIETGEGVILGRGSVVLLQEHPSALRVRLDGPPAARLRQAMRLEGIDEETARRRLRSQDRAQEAYARRFYGVELRDLGLYHLVVDSTALAIESCVELLVAASHSLSGDGEPRAQRPR